MIIDLKNYLKVFCAIFWGSGKIISFTPNYFKITKRQRFLNAFLIFSLSKVVILLR